MFLVITLHVYFASILTIMIILSWFKYSDDLGQKICCLLRQKVAQKVITRDIWPHCPKVVALSLKARWRRFKNDQIWSKNCTLTFSSFRQVVLVLKLEQKLLFLGKVFSKKFWNVLKAKRGTRLKGGIIEMLGNFPVWKTSKIILYCNKYPFVLNDILCPNNNWKDN